MLYRKLSNISGYLRISLILLFVLTSEVFPQYKFTQPTSRKETNLFQIIQQDAENFFFTGLKLVKAPMYFNKNDWRNLGLVVGSTALLFMVDKNVRQIASKNQTSLNSKIFNLDKYYGNIYAGVLSFGSYALGLTLNNDKIRKIGLHSMEAFFYSGLITQIIKFSIGRRRPYMGNSNLIFKPFRLNNDYFSLPSGHATVAFAVSTVMAKSVNNIFWKIFWYAAAGLVAGSRVYHNQHWISDVFLGFAVGYSVGDFVVKLDVKDYNNNRTNIIQPFVSWNRFGVSISLN